MYVEKYPVCFFFFIMFSFCWRLMQELPFSATLLLFNTRNDVTFVSSNSIPKRRHIPVSFFLYLQISKLFDFQTYLDYWDQLVCSKFNLFLWNKWNMCTYTFFVFSINYIMIVLFLEKELQFILMTWVKNSLKRLFKMWDPWSTQEII